MNSEKNNENNRIDELLDVWKKHCINQAIISIAILYKKSQEIISQKEEKEISSISYGIKMINKKVIENFEKYHEIENEYNELFSTYRKCLIELSQYHDTQIASYYLKILEEEIKQYKWFNEIYKLMQEELIAKEKADNSDDEIREKICDIEDEIGKSELKIRRLRPTIRKKIQDKSDELYKAIESEAQELRKEPIKGPRIINKATKFFMGRLSPYKTIKKNVFNNLRNRIETFENSENKKTVKKANEKYLEDNIIDLITQITNEN